MDGMLKQVKAIYIVHRSRTSSTWSAAIFNVTPKNIDPNSLNWGKGLGLMVNAENIGSRCIGVGSCAVTFDKFEFTCEKEHLS